MPMVAEPSILCADYAPNQDMKLARISLFSFDVIFGTVGEPLIELGEIERTLRTLGAQFTRFSPISELSEFNASAGGWSPISSEMHRLLRQSLIASVESKGLVNVAILGPLLAVGYDQSWPFNSRTTLGAGSRRSLLAQAPLPPLTEILDLQDDHARLAQGFALDFGGIAKGLWADMIVDRLGPNSICSLGGDVSCRGGGPSGNGWPILLPNGNVIAIADGAVATSGTDKRRWRDGVHHIIDPRTGLPSKSNISIATAVTDNGKTAEWVAKSAVIGGSLTLAGLRARSDVFAIFEGELTDWGK